MLRLHCPESAVSKLPKTGKCLNFAALIDPEKAIWEYAIAGLEFQHLIDVLGELKHFWGISILMQNAALFDL